MARLTTRREPAGAAILLYHRVAAPSSDPWRLAVHPPVFARQLELLSSRFHPVSLSVLAEAVRAKDVPRGTVALTFDDGYRDNLYEANPILERHEVPATVFVISGCVDSGRDFWWERLDAICRAPGADADRYDAWYRQVRALGHDEREAFLARKEAELGSVAVRPACTLTTSELRLLADGGLVEVGAHTVTHPRLADLDRAEQLSEMSSSKTWLERTLGTSVESFSYPFGVYTDETIACARDAGFSYACTSVRMPVTDCSDPLRLPRFRVGNWSPQELERNLVDWLAAA